MGVCVFRDLDNSVTVCMLGGSYCFGRHCEFGMRRNCRRGGDDRILREEPDSAREESCDVAHDQ